MRPASVPVRRMKNGAAVSNLQARGFTQENAVKLIINGYCEEVFKQLPMEFAVEATKLLGLKLEGSVG